MTTYVDALPSGSYVAVSHGYRPDDDATLSATLAEFHDRYDKVSSNLRSRNTAEILALLPGLELVPPGLVPVHEWWPPGPQLEPVSPAASLLVAVVGRKP